MTTTTKMPSVSATEARVHLGELLRTVSESDAHVAIERGGKPVAVILSQAEYDRLTGKATATQGDWWEAVLASQRAWAEARENGTLPDTVELLREAREERDRQLDEALRRR